MNGNYRPGLSLDSWIGLLSHLPLGCTSNILDVIQKPARLQAHFPLCKLASNPSSFKTRGFHHKKPTSVKTLVNWSTCGERLPLSGSIFN